MSYITFKKYCASTFGRFDEGTRGAGVRRYWRRCGWAGGRLALLSGKILEVNGDLTFEPEGA
jgi:hypothetical protein